MDRSATNGPRYMAQSVAYQMLRQKVVGSSSRRTERGDFKDTTVQLFSALLQCLEMRCLVTKNGSVLGRRPRNMGGITSCCGVLG